MRKKCIHVAKEQTSPHNRYCLQLYFQWRRTIDPSRVYFFDETHFNFETDERDYGRTDSGLGLAYGAMAVGHALYSSANFRQSLVV